MSAHAAECVTSRWAVEADSTSQVLSRFRMSAPGEPVRLASRPPLPPHPPHPWRNHVLVTVIWMLAIGASTRLHAPPAVTNVAVAVHVIGLVLALGPMVLMDWYALVWVSGLRGFRDVVRLTEASHPVIWLGTGLLLLSGALLQPDLGRPLTLVKLGLVLVIVNNGVGVRALGRRLRRLGTPRSLADIPRRLRAPMLTVFLVSQASWWSAAVIGFITSIGRHGA